MENRKITNPKTWKKADFAALVFLILVVSFFGYYVFGPKNGCEVARPGYKCETAWNVMAEHCLYWGNWSCDSSRDVSLPQVEWYISNLCKIHNEYHDNKLDCTNLKEACNVVTGKQIC
jgi:hypothetical protein